MKAKDNVDIEIDKLMNRIWKTREARIVSANRYQKYSTLLDLYSTIYTIVLTVLSVFSLIYKNDIFNYLTVAFSIVVMGFTFYGNTMNFKDRYISMKDNYLKLYDLYYKCILQKNNKNFDFEGICAEYIKILNEAENHKEIDYLVFMRNDINEKNKLTIGNKFNLFFHSILFSIVNLFIIITPLITLGYSVIYLFINA